MMEFINDISTESVFELIKQTYKTETGKDLQIGSDEFAIATVVAYIFGVLVQKFNAQAKQRYLSTATGEYLNALGETFDIERPAPIHASCLVAVVTSAAVTLTAGEFLIADDNGIQFTPSETTALEAGGGTVLFVGYGNENVLDENNIEIGAITEIVTPLAEVESVSNIGVTGGAKDEFPDTDAGDEAYRAYIIEKRSGVSVGGPATAYEQRAKSADGRVVDAYCLRYTDGGYVPGTANVYVLTDDPEIEHVDVKTRVMQALTAAEWKPVCDEVVVTGAGVTYLSPVFTVGLSAKNAVSGRAKFESDADAYFAELKAHLGMAFSLSELARRCQTPDENGVKTEFVAIDNPAHNYVPAAKTEIIIVNYEVQYATV